MMKVWNEQVHVGSGTTVGALTVFPVWVAGFGTEGFRWDADALTVTERAGTPTVGELVVRNTGDEPVVLLEGDLLEGGRQTRLAALSTVLGPGRDDVLPVRCVEQGRWNGGDHHRVAGRRAGYRLLNSGRDASGSLDQQAVWGRISDYDRRHGATRTQSFADHLERLGGAPDIAPVEGQRGVVIGIGGRIVGLEVFGSSDGFAHRWPGLFAAARLDAAGSPHLPAPAEAARQLIRTIGSAEIRVTDRSPSATIVTGRHGSLDLRGLRTGDASIHLRAIDTAHPAIAA